MRVKDEVAKIVTELANIHASLRVLQRENERLKEENNNLRNRASHQHEGLKRKR
jgi:regulator of replication initiation timing